MSDLDILRLLFLAGLLFIVWCIACACLLVVSRLVVRAARAAGHGAHDAWEWTAEWALGLAELGPIDADPELYAARAAAAERHRITVDRDGRRVGVSS